MSRSRPFVYSHDSVPVMKLLKITDGPVLYAFLEKARDLPVTIEPRMDADPKLSWIPKLFECKQPELSSEKGTLLAPSQGTSHVCNEELINGQRFKCVDRTNDVAPPNSFSFD
ncbi:hypothetical protein D5086_004287 [Populus alba]|uniref:Uncharacterized protein n=1 Tax=Populus alba TaxID=43335 RepID=A0ACC4CRE2_POPAL